MQFLQGRQELARWALRTAPKALLGFAVVAEKEWRPDIHGFTSVDVPEACTLCAILLCLSQGELQNSAVVVQPGVSEAAQRIRKPNDLIPECSCISG